ncbi:hypothetical protein BDP55DRAFT_78258 [Colletotrichum godetiae]|uniref:Uncharacterized protein n=1 Tax=Colletotrichum godetiae TaxID=1209918 RepID=A0AAJ0APR8_9PEZI|nr:uncharacterized protein BDP55DRAFT_78258 [Colletotrichum godetiae]KAK1688128.1 hypothetical protein BDP55DRAFT_78258 [Colletotrichum godetiae]
MVIRWCAFAAVMMQPGSPYLLSSSLSLSFGGIICCARPFVLCAARLRLPTGLQEKANGDSCIPRACRALDPNGSNPLSTVYLSPYGCQLITKGTGQGRISKTHRLHTFSKKSRNSRPPGDTHVAVGPPHTWQTLFVTFARNGRTPSFFLDSLEMSLIPNGARLRDLLPSSLRSIPYRRPTWTRLHGKTVHNVFYICRNIHDVLRTVQSSGEIEIEKRPERHTAFVERENGVSGTQIAIQLRLACFTSCRSWDLLWLQITVPTAVFAVVAAAVGSPDGPSRRWFQILLVGSVQCYSYHGNVTAGCGAFF